MLHRNKCQSDCPRCKHGPYFYAYWKDNKGKLRKKYVGKYHPAKDNTNKVEDHASRGATANLSESSERV